jgi:alkanesulfonate monooxygenase SsuD/methylene tetrahydromethanopterin reductase-like flavin-dependent oxidoreductase (luciferase family)
MLSQTDPITSFDGRIDPSVLPFLPSRRYDSKMASAISLTFSDDRSIGRGFNLFSFARDLQGARLSWLLRKTERRARIPSPDQALRFPYSAEERDAIKKARELHIFGSPATVKRRLSHLAASTEADEIIISTMVYDHQVRRHSYELIARKLGLGDD